MKKEQNTTFIPPSTVVEDAVKDPKKKAKSAAPKKKAKLTPKATVTPDEALEETLDFEEQVSDTSPSALDLVRKKSGLSEDDIAMIFELGYENELGRLVGYENLKRLKVEHLKRTGKSDGSHYSTAFGYRGEEYMGPQNHMRICAAYAQDKKQLILRTVWTVFFSILLLLADLPHLILSALPPFFSEYGFALPALSMLILVVLTLPSLRQVKAGLRSLLHFEPTPYSVPTLLLFTALIYDTVALVIHADVLRVNFLVSLAFLMLVVCDLLRFATEHRVVGILSQKEEKHVLIPATPRKKKLRQGNQIVKIINDDIGKNRYQIRSCRDTAGFFRRFNDMESAARPLTVLIAVCFSLATAAAFGAALVHNSFAVALSTFMTVVLLSMPLSVMLSLFYPLFYANRLLSRVKCALLGDETVEELDQPREVIFRDTELYSAEKRTEITVAKGENAQKDLRLAGILFRKLGGTLAPLGASAPDAEADPPISILRVAESGVEAMIDNRHHILAGDAHFLARNGVSVPKESTDKTLRRTSEVSLMYVAIDGTLKLSYEIEYEAKASFERMVCDLAEIDCAAAISSLDPNLDDIFLQKSRFSASDPISVVKPNHFEDDTPLEMADVGVVSLESEENLIYSLFAASGVSKVKRFAFRIQLIASILAGGLTALLILLGQGKMLGIFPILGYQALFSAILLIATLGEINTDTLRLNRKY